MKYNTVLNESYIVATSEQGGILRWDFDDMPQYVFVVWTKYNSQIDPEEVIDFINKGKYSIPENFDVNLSENCSVRLIPVNGALNAHIFSVNVKPATYYVFGAMMIDDEIVVYKPKFEKNCKCNVSDTINYKIETETIDIMEGRLFFKKVVGMQKFAKITIDKRGYKDGALCYTVENCDIQFPISADNVDVPFYVPWVDDRPPIIKSGIDGYIPVK